MPLNLDIIYDKDCIGENGMRILPDKSIDLILADPPYEKTACKWDKIIPFEPMWGQLKRIIKPNGAIVMTASQPFTTMLVASNMKMFKYCWYWNKSKPVGFANAKKMPLKNVEDIIVFYSKLPTYNPQGLLKCSRERSNSTKQIRRNNITAINGGAFKTEKFIQEYTNYPRQILKFSVEQGLHPTQKPVALMEYLIKTYTNEDEIVLDFAIGSGTTAVACKRLNRKYIGFEIEKKYYDIAKFRLLAEKTLWD